ncbi:hypothetical protein [Arenibacter nanhaiticus]|uniref:hypothetical protein n=1 Tax=Arenibacter nanhaiticus TaxID=558155 RepID=UPI000A01F4C4|nr:hypothetical protein [Arenibacter nanhaiticus]
MKATITRILPFSLLAVVHALFISAIFMDRTTIHTVLCILFIILFFTILAHPKLPIFHRKALITDLSTAALVVLGAVLTYSIQLYWSPGPVLAAAMVGTIASFLPSINKKSRLLQLSPAAIYCGCFVGMSHKSIAADYVFIIVAGILSGLVLVMTRNVFQGVSGKLGSIAFGGVSLAAFVMYMLIEW